MEINIHSSRVCINPSIHAEKRVPFLLPSQTQSYISHETFLNKYKQKSLSATFFFLISKKIILKNHKKTKTAHRLQRGEQKRKKKKKRKRKKKTRTQENQQKLITKKRTKEHRDRITRGESPSPRLVKKSATKVSEQLIIGFVPILKSTPVSLPPNAPH